MTKKITPTTIAAMKAGDKMHDAETTGLYVEANRDGSRSWRYLRRMSREHGGRIIKATMGSTRDFTIPDARDWANALNGRVVRGIDPIAEKRVEIATAKVEIDRTETTFKSVWETYIAAITPKQAAKTIQMKKCRMRKDILPKIGSKPITDVTLDDLWEIAQAKIDAGETPGANHTASNHIVADLKSFFAWCQSHGRNIANLNGANPSTHLKKLGDTGERTRFVDAWELPALMRAIAEQDDLARRFFTLILLTGQRLDNILKAEFTQWDDSVDAWIIYRMKGKKRERVPNVLPLSSWGKSLFTPPIIPDDATDRERTRMEKWLFPAVRGEGSRDGQIKPMCDKLVLAMQRHVTNGREIEPIRPHDFRRTLKSHLARLKVAKEIRHAVAGHAESGIDKHYMMYEFMPEKRDALARWEAEVIRIAVQEGVADRLGIPSAEVVEIAKAA